MSASNLYQAFEILANAAAIVAARNSGVTSIQKTSDVVSIQKTIVTVTTDRMGLQTVTTEPFGETIVSTPSKVGTGYVIVDRLQSRIDTMRKTLADTPNSTRKSIAVESLNTAEVCLDKYLVTGREIELSYAQSNLNTAQRWM